MQVLKIIGIGAASLAALLLAAAIGIFGWVWLLGADGVAKAERAGWLHLPPEPGPATILENMTLIDSGWRDQLAGGPARNIHPVCGQSYLPTRLSTIILMEFEERNRDLKSSLFQVSVTCHLASRYSDLEIARFWLRRAWFGSGMTGAEAASIQLFGKQAAQLSELESARLLALSHSPTRMRRDPEYWTAASFDILERYKATTRGPST